MEITHEQYPVVLANLISTISMHIINFGENPLRFTQSYCPETKLWTRRGQITVKNSPIGNPKPDIYNINAHTKFGENRHLLVIVRKRTYG